MLEQILIEAGFRGGETRMSDPRGGPLNPREWREAYAASEIAFDEDWATPAPAHDEWWLKTAGRALLEELCMIDTKELKRERKKAALSLRVERAAFRRESVPIPEWG
jgi:hypothetical protein